MSKIYKYDELPLILMVPQLADFLGIGRCTAYALARSDQLGVLRIGRQIRIPRHSLLRYLGVAESELSSYAEALHKVGYRLIITKKRVIVCREPSQTSHRDKSCTSTRP